MKPAVIDRIRAVWPFLIWLLLFYLLWTTLVTALRAWSVVAGHWPISLTMLFGSYVAGATPMGGGTVAFPVLVLVFDHPGSLGCHFALAIQSVGMVSASIYILSTRKPVIWPALKPTMFGSLVGTPIGTYFVAPIIPDLWVKLTFAVVWAAFGIMHLIKLRELVRMHRTNAIPPTSFRTVFFLVGVAGGLLASITGVGIDMMVYAILVLYFREDLKTAIPTSVIVMAFTSLVGIATNIAFHQLYPDRFSIDPLFFENWLAAAPVVAVGAPLGAFVVSLIPRTPTLVFVSMLCLIQFGSTIIHERVTGTLLALTLTALAAMNLVFHLLYVSGTRMMQEER
ncbi:MAG: sulfite exporter TauE/SafE family protein [Planctomycetaceae bacterium]